MVRGGRLVRRHSLAETDKPPSNTPISNQYSLGRSVSIVTPSEKSSIDTNRESIMVFPISLSVCCPVRF